MKRLWLILLSLILCAGCGAQVKEFRVKVVKEYPHDNGAYTQGLFFHDGLLYETCGQYGASSIRTVDLESGKPVVNKKLSSKYFAEGSAVLDGKLYVLTWMEKTVFRYDAASLRYEASLRWPREGWGLTSNGRELILSDGSSTLYFLDGDMRVHRKVTVKIGDRPLSLLNELEWIEGKVWANVYTTDMIVVINPESGKVEAKIDCKGLLPEKLRSRSTDVLNGIAVDEEGSIYLTGKNWPRLYKVKLTE